MSTTLNIYFFLKMSMIDSMIIFSIEYWCLQALNDLRHSLNATCFWIIHHSQDVAFCCSFQLQSEQVISIHSTFWSLQDCLLQLLWTHRIGVNSSSVLQVYVSIHICCNLFFNHTFCVICMNLLCFCVIHSRLYQLRVSLCFFRNHINQELRLFCNQLNIAMSGRSFSSMCIIFQESHQFCLNICWFCNMQQFTNQHVFRFVVYEQDQQLISHIVNVIWFFNFRMIIHQLLSIHQVWNHNSSNLQAFTLLKKLCKKQWIAVDLLDCIQIWFHLVCKVSAKYQCRRRIKCNQFLILTIKDIKKFLLRSFEYFMK